MEELEPQGGVVALDDELGFHWGVTARRSSCLTSKKGSWASK